MISTDELRQFPFFNFMNDGQLKAVAMIADDVIFEQGEVIVEAEKPANHFFFLVEGEVSYYSIAKIEHDPYYKKEHFIAFINPGEIFGISALIKPYYYTATLKADKVSRVIRIGAPALRALCEVDLKLSCEFYRAVAKAAMERLQHTRVLLVAANNA